MGNDAGFAARLAAYNRGMTSRSQAAAVRWADALVKAEELARNLHGAGGRSCPECAHRAGAADRFCAGCGRELTT